MKAIKFQNTENSAEILKLIWEFLVNMLEVISRVIENITFTRKKK